MGENRPRRDFHVAGDFAQADTGGDGNVDLGPYFEGDFASHSTKNITNLDHEKVVRRGIVNSPHLFPVSSVEFVKRLEGEVEVLFELTCGAYADYLFLRPMLNSKALNWRMERTAKAPSFKRLRMLLYWNLILELVKITDDRDNRGRATSVRSVCDQLESNPGLQAFLEERYSQSTTPYGDRLDPALESAIRIEEEREKREEFKSRLDRVLKDKSRACSSPAFCSYKRIRNKRIAHTDLREIEGGFALFDVANEELKFGREREHLEMIMLIVSDLLGIVRRVEFSWESLKQIHSADALAFRGIEPGIGS